MPHTYKKYKSDADKIKVYDHRVRLAEEQNKKWHPAVRSFWSRYETFHRDLAMTGNGHYISGSTPMVVGNIDSQYSSMTSADIDLTVVPKGRTTEDEAYIAQAALKEEWLVTKAQDRGNVAVKDGVIGGIGFVKVGYEYYEAETEVPRSQADVIAEIEQLLGEADGVKGAPDARAIIEMVPVTHSENTVLTDRIVVDYVPWDMFLWDAAAKQWTDVSWVAQKKMMGLDEVKYDPTFQEYTRSRKNGKLLDAMKADSHIDKDILGAFATVEKEDERVTVYTIYDFETGTICTWAKGAKFLLNETVNPFALNPDYEDKNPFVPIILRKTSSRVRGISEVEVLRDIATEIDLYDSRLATFIERNSGKILAQERVFSDAGKEAMRSQEIGAVVEVTVDDIQRNIMPLTPPQMPAEAFLMPEKLEQKGRDATGVSELQRGLFPDRKRTATETTEVVAASATRASEKRNALEDFWLAIARRILQLMQMFYEADRVIRLSDDEVDISWDYNAADIAGTYGLEISLTPKETKSWQQRRDDALATLNIIGPLAQPGPDGTTPVDVTELLRWVLAEMNTPRRVIRLLLNLPEEQQVQAFNTIQNQAAQQSAAGGQVRADLIPGPLSAPALAAAANTGTIPPEVLAAAGSVVPGGPQAAEQISESAGISPGSVPPAITRPRLTRA